MADPKCACIRRMAEAKIAPALVPVNGRREARGVQCLHLAGGYGHLRYWPFQWQPTPYDRGIRVDVAKID